MDIKDLNQSQLILLAILLSFITSIATGITTVTLMEQAPSSVTIPINRVIQQTVEKIVPGNTTTNTVVIKEEDLVVDAISKNQTSVFSLSKMGQDANGDSTELASGRAFAVSKDGVVVADAVSAPASGTYFLKNTSGKFKVDFVSTDKAGFSFLKIGDAVNGTDKLAFDVPTFGDVSKMKAGQKILTLGSTISSFIFEGNKDIQVSVTKSNAGSLVLNLDGEALGIALIGEKNTFAPIDVIKAALAENASKN